MIDYLVDLDTRLLLFLNSFHTSVMDTFMYEFSDRFVWVPFYAVMLWVVMRYYGWKMGLVVLLFAVGAVAAADQLGATIIRPMVGRLRPANLENPISEFVHVVNDYRGGRYGYPSCHAANTFALAAFISLALPTLRLSLFMLGWALLNSYSRIYLGVHYPGDIITGAVIGCCVAWLLFYGFRIFLRGRLIDYHITERITIPLLRLRRLDTIHIADIIIATGLATALTLLLYAITAA